VEYDWPTDGRSVTLDQLYGALYPAIGRGNQYEIGR
jgi:hypothetical protein